MSGGALRDAMLTTTQRTHAIFLQKVKEQYERLKDALASGVAENHPFILEILQGTAGLGTIGWFTTIRWAGSVAPTQTLTASRKDTFGFIPTSGTTFDGYIVGQNL